MAMTLYFHPASTCSQKVRLALAEKRIEADLRVMDFTRCEHLEDWYLDINPNGVVPTLVHDGMPIVDSSVICEYLDEIAPSPALSPATPAGRARMRAWMRYFEEVPTTAIRVPSFNLYLARVIKGAHDKDSFAAMTERSPLRKRFYRTLTENGFPDEALADSLDRLEQCLCRVDAALADGRRFLLGDDFGLADIVLVPSVVRMIDLGLSHLWQDKTAVTRWIDAVQARPSFAAAFPPEARVDPDNYVLSQGNAA